MTNAVPSRDPANEDSLAGAMRAVLQKYLQNVDDMLPARVIQYDRATNRVQVQPLVAVVTTAGQKVSRAQIASLPVLQLGGGGFVLSFPLKPGDLGWIKANDRDLSLFLSAYREAPPNTARLHSFSDALFVPDVMHGYAIAGEDADNVTLQKLDGSARVTVWSDRVKLTVGASTVTLQNGHLTLDAATVTINAPVCNIAGAVAITGSLSVDGLDFETHKHTGVATGGGTSGGPVP